MGFIFFTRIRICACTTSFCNSPHACFKPKFYPTITFNLMVGMSPDTFSTIFTNLAFKLSSRCQFHIPQPLLELVCTFLYFFPKPPSSFFSINSRFFTFAKKTLVVGDSPNRKMSVLTRPICFVIFFAKLFCLAHRLR